MKKTISVFLLIAGLLIDANAFACTTIIVGRGATDDGSMIIARNEDTSGAAEAHNLIFHPARKEGAVFRSNAIGNDDNNAFTCPLPKNALAYTSFPFWRTLTKPNHSYEETGINAYGVAMSATETIFNSPAALKADPYEVKKGLIEDAITSIILPYATSAREGVRLLGEYVEKAGAGEGFGVAFLDAREAWYFETASGHHWLAQRIPDDSYFVSANQGRFQTADIADRMNVMSSPGLIAFAATHGLYDPKSGPFNFFRAYIRDIENDKTYNYPRVRELLRLYSDFPTGLTTASTPSSPSRRRSCRCMTSPEVSVTVTKAPPTIPISTGIRRNPTGPSALSAPASPTSPRPGRTCPPISPQCSTSPSD